MHAAGGPLSTLLSLSHPAPQVITEVFNWTRNPVEARRLATRREALLREMLAGRKPLVSPGVTQLMDILQRNQVGARRLAVWREGLEG